MTKEKKILREYTIFTDSGTITIHVKTADMVKTWERLRERLLKNNKTAVLASVK